MMSLWAHTSQPLLRLCVVTVYIQSTIAGATNELQYRSDSMRRECVGCDGLGNMYEIQQNIDGEWDILKQGRYEVTFNTRTNALTVAQYLVRQHRDEVIA